MTAPGWYKDPVDPDVQRYWDGDGWTGDPVSASAPTPSAPPVESPPVESPPVESPSEPVAPPVEATPEPVAPLSQGAVILPPGTPIPPGGFPPGQLPPGAIVLPPGTPLPPGLMPQGTIPAGAVQVLLPPQPGGAAGLTSLGEIRPHGYQLATLGSRLLARLIDIAMVALLNAVVTGWFIYQYAKDVRPVISEINRRWLAQEPIGDLAFSDRATTLSIVILILVAALWFAYEVPAIASGGQTFGKRMVRIKVVGLDADEPIGFGRAIRRWNPLGLWTLMWTTCGIGFVLQLIDSLSPLVDFPLRRALHDRAARTIVVAADKPV